jgi:beta-phosphoglucomutase
MKQLLTSYKAILFDLNGTMIDDMQYHVKAWTAILNNDLNARLSHEQVVEQMYGKNEELLVRVFGKRKFSKERMLELSMEKERRYQAAYLPELKLIDGLEELLKEARSNKIKMAIGSAAIPFNIDFVLDNLYIRDYFDTIVSADDVAISKPDPDTYLQCAKRLGVKPADCIVFEDAPKGVESAERAGMDCIVLTTLHSENEFAQFENVIRFISDYNQL